MPELKSGNKPASPPHKNHRKRMRDRIFMHGPDTLVDYELLEVLLFAVLPRRDTKPIAKALLARFKTLRQLLAADIDELTEIDGIGRDAAIFINAMSALFMRTTKEEAFDDAPILRSWDAVLDFLKLDIGLRETECFVALFLGANNKLLQHDILASGTVNRVSVYPREIVKLALKCHAVSVIIAHNHPSGDVTPSKQDINMTYAIRDALQTVEIKLHDHIIIGQSKHESFKQLGLI